MYSARRWCGLALAPASVSAAEVPPLPWAPRESFPGFVAHFGETMPAATPVTSSAAGC